MSDVADKRIPVTEGTWRELHDLKQPGQTFDELLAQLIKEHNRRQLAERARKAREAEVEELTSLDDI